MVKRASPWQRGERMLRRYGPQFVSFAKPYIQTALRQRLNGTATRTGNRMFGGAGQGVTSQYDAKWVYRRRRMPRRKRRRWVRAIKRHRAIDMKSLATQTVVRNDANLIGGSNGSQAVGYVELYGLNGVPGAGYGADDIVKVLDTWLGSGGSTPNRKYIFGSAVLDLTFTNQGTSEGETGTVELDIYRCVYRKKTLEGNPVIFYQTSAASMGTLPGGSTLGLTSRGWTPFNCPAASEFVKILSKKKYLLSHGQSCTYQIRDPKNRYFSSTTFSQSTITDCMPGYTQFLLFIVKHVPANEGPAPAFQCVFGVTRSYTFKVDEYALAETAFKA